MKKVLIIILICIVAGAAVGIYMWNKPHKKVENATGISVTATALCNAYGTDEAKANTQYLNKALIVSGEVADVTKNQDGGTVVLLKSADPMLVVQCTMRDKNAQATKRSNITIAGFCSGNDITSVLLTDCIIK
ncbi:MAG: OB-fold protein [Flavipsychrobacter sp.]